MDPIVLSIGFLLISLLVGFSLHEAGHAYAATHLGDDTARSQGRLTINPIPHLDLFGSVLLPGILIAAQWPSIAAGNPPLIFAAAKPVPVNPMNFKRPLADFAFVAAAGPMVNIFLAVLGALALNFVSVGTLMLQFLNTFIYINLVLAFFNLLPVPPLDGSKIVAAFLPRPLAWRLVSLDRIGFLLIIGLIVLGQVTGFSLISLWIGLGIEATLPLLSNLANLIA